jgi:hypothetical protein
MPGWVTTHTFAASISMMVAMRVNAIVSAPSMPAAPPLSPLPAPRGTTGMRNSVARRMSCETSAVVVGSATASGSPVSR